MELTTLPGKTLPKPPNHLKAAGRRLWADIVAQYRIYDAVLKGGGSGWCVVSVVFNPPRAFRAYFLPRARVSLD